MSTLATAVPVRASHATSARRSPARLVAALALTALAPAALAQVTVAPFPTSHLDVSTGWSGWWPFNFPYGAGNPSAGSSGTVAYSYAIADINGLTVNIDELRNSAASPFAPSVTHSGEIFFQPYVPALQYNLAGTIGLIMSGMLGSSNATGTLSLEQVGGPILAAYSGSLSRIGASEVGGLIFDAAAPITGSQTGFVFGTSTYRLAWNFNATTILAGDTTALVNVDPAFDSFFQISFAVPAPGAGALLLLGTAAASRRRRPA